MKRAARAIVSLVADLRGVRRVARGPRSAFRLAVDMLGLRLVRVTGAALSDRVREIVLADGLPLRYRMNRGDLQSLREVWMDEIYRPPMAIRPDVVVDLGANIGLTTRWLRHTFASRQMITVEASAANNALLEFNVASGTHVFRAAAGPSDGVAFFAGDDASNLGRIAAAGDEIAQISIGTALAVLPAGTRVDLLKLDIEGGEQLLLTTGDLRWLDRVDAIIAEFHPDVVDYAGLVQVLVDRGFTYVPAGVAWRGSMDAFFRVP